MGNACTCNAHPTQAMHDACHTKRVLRQCNDVGKTSAVKRRRRKNEETKAEPHEDRRSRKTRQRPHTQCTVESLSSSTESIRSGSSGATLSSSSSSLSENLRIDDDHLVRSMRRPGSGTTILSKKCVIINIFQENQKHPKEDNSMSKKRVFQDFISDKEQKQKSNTRSPFSNGNFIDTGKANLLPVSDLKVWVEAAGSVCHIYFPTSSSQLGTATGFRVGGEKPYIMTANHVVEYILNSGYQRLGLESQNRLSALQQTNVYVMFGYINERQPVEVRKFFLKPTIQFSDESLDVAILELDDCSETVPSSAFQFFLCKVLPSFTFIGHSQGKPMTADVVDKIIHIDSAQTKSDIEIVKKQSKQHMQSFNCRDMDYECLPHNVLANPKRHLFHCKCSKGASGSPGVVALEDGRVAVVTMLLCGYPDWYYDEKVGQNIKNTWPQEYCVEQGVNVASLYDTLLANAPQLCQEIFIDTFPTPNL